MATGVGVHRLMKIISASLPQSGNDKGTLRPLVVEKKIHVTCFIAFPEPSNSLSKQNKQRASFICCLITPARNIIHFKNVSIYLTQLSHSAGLLNLRKHTQQSLWRPQRSQSQTIFIKMGLFQLCYYVKFKRTPSKPLSRSVPQF